MVYENEYKLLVTKIDDIKATIKDLSEEANDITDKIQANLFFELFKGEGNELKAKLDTIELQLLEHDFEDGQIQTIKRSVRMLRRELRTIQVQIGTKQEAGIQGNPNAEASDFIISRGLAKLPVLDLVLFDGKVESFLSFWDSFQSTIHSRKDLPNIEKFKYFKSVLKGEALVFANRYLTTNDNYLIMMEAFEKEYRKTSELVYINLQSILEISPIKRKNRFALKNLVSVTQTALHNLKTLGQPIDQWDAILDKLILDRIDADTHEKWKFARRGDHSIPKLENLLDFIHGVAESINSDNCTSLKTHSCTTSQAKIEIRRNSCKLCKAEHYLNKCPAYLKLSPQDRLNKIKSLRLCFRCFSNQHMAFSCTSNRICFCKGPHDSTLHDNFIKNYQSPNRNKISIDNKDCRSGDSDGKSSKICVTQSSLNSHDESVLLATAQVRIIDDGGKIHIARVLLDSGSQCTSICSQFARKLKIQRSPTSVLVSGIGAHMSSQATQEIEIKFSSLHDHSEMFGTKALILERLTCDLPEKSFMLRDSSPFQKLRLADPSFNKSGKIDIILGGNIVYEILFGKKIIDFPKGFPSAMETPLGHVLFGQYNSSNSQNFLMGITLKHSQQDSISRLWELEDISNSKVISKMDKQCEYEFSKSLKQICPGRFSVNLLFKEFPPNLGHSFKGAEKRFHLLERRFSNDPILKTNYKIAFKEYLDSGHMEPIINPNLKINHFYLPHHPILKEQSLTTKLRIVFDGSFSSSNGVSLNQTLHTGPSLQQDIRHLLLRIRFFKFVITADLKQMYRQILINPPHQEFLRVLWRDSPSDELQHFKLKTVTFGLSSAPFCAIRILHHLADQNEIIYPEASRIIKEHFYVDDLLTGSNDRNDLIKTISEVVTILKQSRFLFDKWACNDKIILNKLQSLGHETHSEASLALLTSANTLGINWNVANDRMSFNFKISEFKYLTKRLLLSTLAKIYDPLGILSPFLILLKFMLQDAWLLKLSWDSKLPEAHQNIWKDLVTNFELLDKFSIPRLALLPNAKYYEIHGFADASIRGYGICVYLLSFCEENNFTSNLLFAKSKVSPTHFISIPKLELCSCHLLASSYQFYSTIIPIPIKNVFFYSDSKIALGWINSENLSFKTFVANRVHDINTFAPYAQWKYINTSLNPADIVSRGLTMSKLVSNDLWLIGPFKNDLFIQNFKNNIPMSDLIADSSNQSEFSNEIKPLKLISNILVTQEILINRFSNITRLKRTVAYVLQFSNSLIFREFLKTKILSLSSLEKANILITRISQLNSFPNEHKLLKNGQEIPSNSILKNLTPFFDKSSEVIRVGGRLKHSALSYSTKHPIVISNKCHLSTLLVRHAHQTLNHADYSTIATFLRASYWIIKLRSIVKTITNECIICRRFKVSRFQQLMGNLPIERVNPSPIFSCVGIDCAGPFSVTPIRKRKCIYNKYYICIFICFATRAVHIEALSSLSTDSFIMSLSRFISRRGVPQQIHSDCGTNFVGCHNELKGLYKFFASLKCDEKLSNYSLENQIQWFFNPPSSPHFGGFWESNIKIFKYYLKRSCSSLQFALEEFHTLIYKIESILNSRPLYPLSDSITDYEVLTPGHFITGRPITSLPEKDLSDCNLNRLSRWELVQNRTQHLWKRWSTSYLHSLQQRRKWFDVNTHPFVGQLILLCESTNPLQWIRGRIIEIFPGSDDLTRVVKVKTQIGEYKRPLVKLAPLLTDASLKH